VSANVKVILARYGYSPAEPVKEAAAKTAKKSAAPVALPEAVDGAPVAADYRVPVDAVDHSLCLGRRLDNGEDKRWKPIIYRESQCSSKPTDGSLCKSCNNRQAKYVETGKPGPWNGLITEEPPAWCHMLGTQWATEKNVKFAGASGTVTPVAETAATETVVPVQMPTATAPTPATATTKVDKDAAKAAKEAEKAAAKSAKEAEKAAKEAQKAAEKAAKEAEKEAKKAEKEAKKSEKKPAAKKAEKAAAPATTTTTPTEPVKADTSAPVTKTSWELKLINGAMYSVSNGNVYDYDELTQKPGDFVGRLTADETIDADAEEITGDESDSE
jgi:chemotaxis protein histidine kinase CheA